MAVTPDDVRHIAMLARLGVDEAKIPALVGQLNGILGHMEALQQVDTTDTMPAIGVGSGGMPLRQDTGIPIPLARAHESYAPQMRDGFFIVPRLATHTTAAGVVEAEEELES